MMFGEFAPIQTLPLTIVTERLLIRGSIQTRRHRLTDLLNEDGTDHLVIADATFSEHGSHRVVARGQAAQVSLDAILFAHTTGQTESGTEMRTSKQPVQATMLVPPFTVEGLIHLPLEESLRNALDEYRGRFVAVTKATYWAYGVAEAPQEAELLVINHARLHVCIGDNVHWTTAGAGGGAAGGGW